MVGAASKSMDVSSGCAIQGFLAKKSGDSWQRRWFELSGTTLRYYRDKGDTNVRGELVLDQRTSVAPLPNKTFGIQVIVAGGRALKVAAGSEEDCHNWKTHLNSAIMVASETYTVNVAGQDFVLHKRYTPKRKVGSGAYGMVVEGVDEQTGKKVAIKKIAEAFNDMIDAKRILREIRLMSQFSHPNIIALYDMITPSSVENFEDVYILTEKMSTDMQQIIFSKTPLNEDQQQWIMYQCLCGLNYMHSCGVLHRDLKPANLLIDTDTCDVKICDFGLSRGQIPGESEGGSAIIGEGDSGEDEPQAMTEYVVTRWYRAPEIMLGYHHYNEPIDVWSMGCIFGELLGRKPLLPGEDYIHQLKLIVKLVGSPAEDDLWYISNRNARSFMMHLPQSPPSDMHVLFPEASEDAIDLLQRMLVIDPSNRITVEKALVSAYLAPVREDRLEITGSKVDVSDIEAMTLSKINLQRMMFEEIRRFHDGDADGAAGAVNTARTTGMQPATSASAAGADEASAGPERPPDNQPLAAQVPQQAEMPNDPMEQSLNG